MNSTMGKELRELLEHLTPARQRELLAHARTLSSQATTSHSPIELARFVGSIDPTDLDEMSAVIDAGCEQTSSNEW